MGGYSTSGEGGVNYVGDHGRNGWQTGFDKGGVKRIKLTGDGFGFAGEFIQVGSFEEVQDEVLNGVVGTVI